MRLPRFVRLPRARLALLVVAGLIAGAIGVPAVARFAVARRIEQAARARGLEAHWRAIEIAFPARVSIARLVMIDAARGDTVIRGDSLVAVIDPLSIALLGPRARRLELYHARLAVPRARPADPDTLAPEETPADRHRDPSERVRRAADALVRALLLPARRMPRIELRDVTLAGAPGEDASAAAIRVAWLELAPGREGIRLEGEGTLIQEREVPFSFSLRYGHDDRLSGGASFGILDAATGRLEPLRIAVEGAISQDRRAGVVRIADSTRVTLGNLPFFVSGALGRIGPTLRFRLAANGLNGERVLASVPRPLLGPVAELGVRGSWDYRLSFRLDVSRPDSVDFRADVVPHGLSLEAAQTRLNLLELEEPFVAAIHLPHGRTAVRDLSPENPHFRPLEAIDSLLTYAVVTNEDGGFFRHRGFNTEAVKRAIADNLRAGAFRRGAGTITMQLARNLYLGHERTLSRKAQEVVLAWVLEHLTWVSKRRLLELYLNIIEWGPGVHGADEAARYYFDRDATRLTVDQALFLTTVIPAPTKWRYRFDPSGALRPFERAQMHFIGRAMVAKGWLAPSELAATESLRVELAGPAREAFFPAPPAAAADSLPI